MSNFVQTMNKSVLYLRIMSDLNEERYGCGIEFPRPLNDEERIELLTFIRAEVRRWWTEKCKG